MREPIDLAWLTCLWTMADRGEAAATPLAGRTEGRRPHGRGAGGDITIELDRVAEEAILRALGAGAPGPYIVVSEEVGEQAGEQNGSEWRVLVDPVDGSLNAKRGLEPFCAALAVADGPSLGDVRVGLIADYPRGYRYLALRGAGWASTRIIDGYTSADRVELILTEMGRPENAVFSFREMGALAGWPAAGGWKERPPELQDYRVRQVGSLALSLSYTASAVGDVLFCPTPARSVDIAAGLLMLREAGGDAASLDGSDLWVQPLDLARRAPFLAWRPGLKGDEVLQRARELWASKPR